MAKITALEQQKRNRERLNIYVEEEFFIALYKDVVVKHQLFKGKEIDEESLKKILVDEEYSKAKNQALRMVARYSYSKNQIRKKLKDKEYLDETIDKVIGFLEGYRFIDDEELARKMASDKIRINKYGRRRVANYLKNKGLEEEHIKNALEETCDDDTEFENALACGYKKLKSIKKKERNEIYKKISYYLSYRGYSYSIIKKVLDKILGEIDF